MTGRNTKANASRNATRKIRKATPAERRKYAALRGELEGEKPRIVSRGRRIKAQHDALVAQTMRDLRAEREAQGLSLAQMQRRSGMTRAALCRLETAADANPTLATIERYAAALGKRLELVLKG
jgi:DNA-binding phage protein